MVCEICQTTQAAPADGEAWACRQCGQAYQGRAITLSERQLAGLRTQAGRDASGKGTLVTNWWIEHKMPAGEEFLDFNKVSPARDFCRKMILDSANAGEIKTILEVAFGGLHEYRAMRAALAAAGVTYSGVDWTTQFVAHAQKEFPENRWTQGDVVRGLNVAGADLLYTQHMMEHLPALEPAFSNLLRLAKKRLINIFFIPPKPFDGYEVVNYRQYPLYHNTYGIGHIEAVCKANGFGVKWHDFGKEVVLVAERT